MEGGIGDEDDENIFMEMRLIWRGFGRTVKENKFLKMCKNYLYKVSF